MSFEEGQRASFTVTGTVISQEEFMERLAGLVDISETPGREKTHLLLDSGVVVRVDTTDDELGLKLNAVKPRYWPAVNGDVWTDDQGDSWYAVTIDFGHRQGLRLKHFSAYGETIRSLQWFLDNNVKPRLMIRGDSFV